MYKQRNRGVAMMIVLIMVAMSALLAVALLSSGGTSSQAMEAMERSTASDSLAQSGLAMAEYYLQYPSAAPVLSNGYYPGQTGVTFGSAANGTVDIAVTQASTNTYAITSTAKYGSTGNLTTRSLAAVATVNYTYTPADAVAVNGGLNVYSNMTINGSVHANGGVTIALGASINGMVYAPSLSGLLSSVLGFVTTNTSGGTNVVPQSVASYLTYSYNGLTYSAQKISYTAATLGPTANNPMGVYYDTGDVTLTSALTLNGTLLVPNGKLIIKNTVNVTAQSGMPAIMVNSDLQFSGASKKLTATGLSYIGGQLTKSGTSASDVAIFNGALQFFGSNAVDKNYPGTVTINYDKTKATVNNFLAGSGNNGSSVTLTSFKNSASN